MIVDIHCHYVLSRLPASVSERFSFEPLSASDQNRVRYPTDYDSCISARAAARLTWRAARWLLRFPPPGPDLDRRLASEYQRHLVSGGVVDRFVLLAFDAVHDDEGHRPPLPSTGEQFGSDIYTSNSLVRDLCRRYPERFLFGASVHPYRPDALACIDEVFAAGACLLKWIPLHHNIDFADPRTRAVLRHCAAIGLPVLVHCGEEFTLRTQAAAGRSIRPLLETLRRLRREDGMPCIVVAHVATPVTPWGDRESYGLLVEALAGEFADAPLYADISALVTWAKSGYLRRLARRQDLHAKLLFGSDFPIPPGLALLRPSLGHEYPLVAAAASWPERAALACRALGFNEIVFQRAAGLLPNVDYFAPRPPRQAP